MPAVLFFVLIAAMLWFVAISMRKVIGTIVSIIAFSNPFTVMCWLLAILAAVGIWAAVGQ